MKCTATDSYRLSIKTIPLETPLKENINIIIPTKNLLELTKLLTNDEENIEMHIFNNKVIFKFSCLTMMTRLISGTYPDTSKLIPDTFNITMKINLQDFYGAIDRASLLTNESDKNTIKLESIDDKIVITSNIPEIGNVEETLKVKKSTPDNIKIAFNSKFMMEAIKVIESEELELNFNGEFKPIIIKSPNNEDLIGLILPIRTY